MSNYTRNTLTGDLTPVNAELEKIETAIADQLDRKPDPSEANQLEDLLDINSQAVINLRKPLSANEAARLQDVQAAVAGFPDDTGDTDKFLQTNGLGSRIWAIVTALLVSYDNTSSGLTATTVQDAIDEVDSQVDTNTTNIGTNTSAIAALIPYYSVGTVRTTNFTAILDEISPIDTTSGTIDVITPVSPSVDDKFAWIDLASNFGTNNAILKFNTTDKLMGLSEDLNLDLRNFNSGIIYTGSSKGWMFL